MKKKQKAQKRPITPDEIETVIKKLPTHKSTGPDSSTGEFYRTLKGELPPSSTDYIKKFKKMEDSQTLLKKPTSS